MRTVIISAIVLGFSVASNGQEYKSCTYSYFKDRKISTAICYDKDRRWGKATAYDHSGKVIHEWEVRRVAGNASVAFEYYPNGAVRSADWHSAPDGGIQWYSSKTTFAENGTITSEVHNDYDDDPAKFLYKRITPDQRTPVVKCAEIYATEYCYINKCPFQVSVTSVGPGIGQRKVSIVGSADTIKGGEYIMAEQFADIPQLFKFNIIGKNKRQNAFTTYWLPVTQAGKSVKRYTLVIEPL